MRICGKLQEKQQTASNIIRGAYLHNHIWTNLDKSHNISHICSAIFKNSSIAKTEFQNAGEDFISVLRVKFYGNIFLNPWIWPVKQFRVRRLKHEGLEPENIPYTT